MERQRVELVEVKQRLKKDMIHYKTSINHVIKANDNQTNSIKRVEEEIEVAEHGKSIDLKSIGHLEREILENRKLNSEDERQLEELANVKSLISSQLGKTESVNKKQSEDIMSQEGKLKVKEKELSQLKIECEMMDKNIVKLDKEKQKFGLQAAQANAKYFQSLE